MNEEEKKLYFLDLALTIKEWLKLEEINVYNLDMISGRLALHILDYFVSHKIIDNKYAFHK